MKLRYFFGIFLALSLFLCTCGTIRSKPEVFTVDWNSPKIKIGELETQFDTFLSIGGIKKSVINIFYYPREDAVSVQYIYNLTTYHQFWSRSGRAAFINALAKYKDEYEARSLNSRGSSRTMKEYGIVNGYLIWQLTRFTVRAMANMNVELGYSFKNRNPYFAVNQREAEYIDPISRDNNRTSSTITMFFTRAQADELAALFDQEYLNGLRLINDSSIDFYTDEDDIPAEENSVDEY